MKDIFYEEILRGDGDMPTLFHLHQNFRTHSGNYMPKNVWWTVICVSSYCTPYICMYAGIIEVANSIVELITHFFPDTIDKLDPEASRVIGAPPIFIER